MPPAMAHVLKKSVVPAPHASAVAEKVTGTMNQSTTLRYAMSIDVKCKDTEVLPLPRAALVRTHEKTTLFTLL